MQRTTAAFAVLAAVGLGIALPATAQAAAPHSANCPNGFKPGFALSNNGLFQACVVADETANPALTDTQLVPAKPAKPAKHQTPAQHQVPNKPARHQTPAKPAQPAKPAKPAQPAQHQNPAKPQAPMSPQQDEQPVG
ncbi:hypothetical protein ABZ832_28190 [Streptantibioticus parmotrematis]|uniref:hypothetical protein n=1 Tax=Streptantibioticus parmotrematis TaxID=2873249 RepID=UPI0033E30A7C